MDTCRFAQLFDLNRAEVYVHGICEEPGNDRFNNLVTRGRYAPLDGDVFVYFPGAHGSIWKKGFSAAYRYEDEEWKIVASE